MDTVPVEMGRKPAWIRMKLPGGEAYGQLRRSIRELGLHTVCQEARCPNIGECWSHGTATLMVLGDVCTRGCRFCHVKSGRPAPPDPLEPERVGRQVAGVGLDYVVLTSVDRDDLPDLGAGHFAACVREIRQRSPKTHVEVLIPDFQGNMDLLKTVMEAGPVVVAQNQETVRRLTHPVRDRRASYDTTLEVLRNIKRIDSTRLSKTSFMVGLGETFDELLSAMDDCRQAGVDIVTFGQYLRPGPKYLEVQRYYTPTEFAALEEAARARGFLFVASGPMVRSSYRAGELFVMKTLSGVAEGSAAVRAS